MEHIKRVEIILPHPKLESMVELLENAKVEGYTVIDNVQGKGNRGTQDGLGLTDAFTNSMIIWYAKLAEIENLKEPIRQLLGSAGGICALSDASWLTH